MIRRRPRAIDAIIEQAEYIGQDSPASAERFIAAIEETFHQLEQMPGLGHIYETDHSRLAGIRVCSVKGFRNYLIFYRPFAGGIEIITLIHGARDIPKVLEEDA